MILKNSIKNLSERLYLLLTILLFLATSACAIAPLTEEHTANTLGKSNNEWGVQLGLASSIAYKRGLSDKFDLGLVFEYQAPTSGLLFALTGKHQLIHGLRPISLIGNFGIGTGTTFGSIGVTYDAVNKEKYILNFNLRFNAFKWDLDLNLDENDSSNNNTEVGEFITDVIEGGVDELNGTYSYVSINMSNTYRFNPIFSTTLSLGGYLFLDSGAVIQPNVGLKFNFNY